MEKISQTNPRGTLGLSLETMEPFGLCPGQNFISSSSDFFVNPLEGVEHSQKCISLKATTTILL